MIAFALDRVINVANVASVSTFQRLIEVMMSLLGAAAIAMGWTIKPEQRAEFGDWHSPEHFPERMGIPGFRCGDVPEAPLRAALKAGEERVPA